MKILKWIGLGLLSIIVLLMIVSFATPTKYGVERSVVIQSSEERVFSSINRWSEFAEWSPWSDLDSAMVVRIEGEDGTVGSIYHWKGNEAAGAGKMVKTEVINNQRIAYDLIFTEPFESTAQSWMDMAPQQNGIKVSWGMKGEMSRPMNLLLLMTDMNGEIGKDFDKGLMRIKERLEKALQFSAEEVQLPEMNLIYVERETNMDSIIAVTSASFIELERFISMSGLKVTGAPMAIYKSWSEEAINVSLAYPVETLPESINGQFAIMKMTSIPALKAVYKGDYDLMEGFYNEYVSYMDASGYERTELFIEEYITDPEKVQDKTQWITHVYFELKPKDMIQ